MHRDAKRLILALVASLPFVGSCISNEAVAPVDPKVFAKLYLDSALTLMKTQAYYRKRVNWDSVRANALLQAEGATRPQHTYPAIRQALLALGDNHSQLVGVPATSIVSPTIGTRSMVPGVPIDSLYASQLDGKFGMIHVPSYSGFDAASLADTLHQNIKKIDALGACGWIVDLRRNRGGNMWPMLAGVGPLLGNDDNVGAFLDADSATIKWFYTGGTAGQIINGTKYGIVVTPRPYVLKQPNPPVAVLTDSLTASAGEAIAVAFRGLARARSFGGATYGVPTANLGYVLPDGAVLYLTVGIDVDRTGTSYETRIIADTPLFLSVFPRDDDVVVELAKTWLATQPGC